MKNSKVFILGLVVGVLVTFICNTTVKVINGMDVYELKRDILTSNGSKIVKGTKMVKECSMPEGYDSMMLFLNVSRGEIDRYFKNEGAGLHIPYWFD
ncbi:MAG TPA: hypothetical protein VEC37_17665 [Bacillota bacterium]|nr:hypothetical protein [Bacillota bacterium]